MAAASQQWFVSITQTIFWCIFMTVDLYLLLPTMLWRYIGRVKSKNEIENGHGRRGRGRHPRTVVIVGGNFSGLTALRELQNNPLFRVILIDQRDYFEYTPGILRCFCEPSKIYNLCHPLPHGSHQIIQGKVTKTSEKSVTYTDSITQKVISIPFDYLILATGSTYHRPVTASKDERTIAARAAGWKVEAQRMKEASSILILGGGAVGTELAAEIAGHYHSKSGNNNNTNKSITLVDASPRLVPIFPEQVAEYAEEWLKSHGVHLVLGQMLDRWDNQSCTLKNGTRIIADLVFVCFGDKPNSSPMIDHQTNSIISNKKKKGTTTTLTSTTTSSTTMPSVKLDRRKCIKTDAFLRVEGRRNVFCCGDVAAPPTEGIKQAFHAEVMGHVAAENVIRLANGLQFKRYPEDAASDGSGSHTDNMITTLPLVYVLNLGKWDGVIGFNSLTVPGPLAAVLKWIIEWTKVRQMLGRPIGLIIWIIGDAIVFFLSRTLLKPIQKNL